jgi:hypothetical protein
MIGGALGTLGTNRCVNKAITTPIMTNTIIANSAIPAPLIQPVSNPILNT